MKTLITLVTIVSALSVSRLVASDDNPAPDVGERLMLADLSVALKQYEKVEQMIAETRVDLALLALRSDEPTAKEKATFNKRIEILDSQARDLRDLAQHYDDQMKKHHAVAMESRGN